MYSLFTKKVSSLTIVLFACSVLFLQNCGLAIAAEPVVEQQIEVASIENSDCNCEAAPEFVLHKNQELPVISNDRTELDIDAPDFSLATSDVFALHTDRYSTNVPDLSSQWSSEAVDWPVLLARSLL